MATLSEHAATIKAAIKAARQDGYRLSLGNYDEDAYVDLEEYRDDSVRRRLVDWENIIEEFD